MKNIRAVGAAAVLCIAIWGGGPAIAQTAAPLPTAASAKAVKFLRTELYFGLSRPDGTTVSEPEWAKFLADEVTPRFPDGFTSLQAAGQYRDRTGRIVKEPSRVLVFLYSRKSRTLSRSKIDEIRSAYITQFQQESVLRLDFKHTVVVYF